MRRIYTVLKSNKIGDYYVVNHRAPMYSGASKQPRQRGVTANTARVIYAAMDDALRKRVHAMVDADQDRVIEFLRDPVHLAQLKIEVINGFPVFRV